jgi:hypothetical protein
MLNAMREFATERIEASPELATRARAAHADHYTAWLVQIVERMAGSGRAESLDDLGAEVENLAIAWRWAVDSGDVERLQVLLGGLRPLYDARGWYRGLIAMIDETLVMLEGLPSSPGRVVEAATLQSDRARAMSAIDGYSDAVEAAFERVLAAYEGGDLSHAYPVLRSLASFHTFRNESDRALPFARQILAIGETVGDPAMRISGHTFIGSSLSFLGRLTDGSPDLEAGADLAVAAPSTGDWYRLGPDPRVSCLTALSLFRFWEGRLDASLLRSSEAVAVARAGNHPSSLGYGLHHASFLHTMRGEPELARALAVESVELATEHDLHIWRAVGTVILGAAAVALGATEEGMGWVREGLERYRGLRTPPVFWPFLLEVTANACRLGGETEFGLASIDEALMLSPRAAWMRLTKGGLLAGRDPKAAEGEYEQALAGSLAWGAATPALAAAVALYRLTEVDGSEHQRIDDRRDQVRAIVPMFTEGLDYPLLVEAQAIIAVG